jgi:hypothetical protein
MIRNRSSPDVAGADLAVGTYVEDPVAAPVLSRAMLPAVNR